MDSSRSGLLSTLLMTLPLIVVPAIALLRTPGGLPGVSTSPLSAADSDSENSDPGDLTALLENPPDGTSAPARAELAEDDEDSFHELFRDEDEPDPPTSSPKRRTTSPQRDSSVPSDPFVADDQTDPPAASAEATDSPRTDNAPGMTGDDKPDVAGIITKLTASGALKTVWFEPGAAYPVGLAVFFRGKTELVRIRFEAVGPTRIACARSVLQQFTDWQRAGKMEP